MPQLQEGETITIGKRTRTIAYVNQQLKLYQVNYSKRRAELISFDQVEGCADNEGTNRGRGHETVVGQEN